MHRHISRVTEGRGAGFARRAFVPKADKLAWLPGVLRGGPGVVCACEAGLRDLGPLGVLLLIDIVKRERETQAARVLAGSGVTWSRTKQRSLSVF